jgi:hypothetical protein
MSLNAEKHFRLNQTRCGCGRHAIFFRPNGHGVGRRPDHDLCPACWRRSVDRCRRVRPRVY